MARRLARTEQVAQVRIARDLVRRCRALTRDANDLEREIALLVASYAPQLLTLKGCGALIAAKIIGETAGIARFRSDAQFACLAGVPRFRHPRGSSDAIASAATATANSIRRCTRPRSSEAAGTRALAHLERRQKEGKSRREALRALKRHLARFVFQLCVLTRAILRGQSRSVAATFAVPELA